MCLFEKIYIKRKLIPHIVVIKMIKNLRVELETKTFNLSILSLHRAPTRDFNQVAKNPVDMLNYLYKPKTNFLFLVTQIQIVSLKKRNKIAKYNLLRTPNVAKNSEYLPYCHC